MAKRVTRKSVDQAGGDWTRQQLLYGDNSMSTQRAMAKYYDLKRTWEEQQSKGRNPMARRMRLVRRRNQGSTGELPYDEWIPAHAVKFNHDGTTSLMTESEHTHNRERRRNVARRKPAARRKARRR